MREKDSAEKTSKGQLPSDEHNNKTEIEHAGSHKTKKVDLAKKDGIKCQKKEVSRPEKKVTNKNKEITKEKKRPPFKSMNVKSKTTEKTVLKKINIDAENQNEEQVKQLSQNTTSSKQRDAEESMLQGKNFPAQQQEVLQEVDQSEKNSCYDSGNSTAAKDSHKEKDEEAAPPKSKKLKPSFKPPVLTKVKSGTTGVAPLALDSSVFTQELSSQAVTDQSTSIKDKGTNDVDENEVHEGFSDFEFQLDASGKVPLLPSISLSSTVEPLVTSTNGNESDPFDMEE